MNFKLKFEDNLKLKFIFLVVLFLMFFYFLIYKNILNYLSLKEYINSEEIKIQKLTLENNELKNSLIRKKKNLEEEILLLENRLKAKHNKQIFPKISDALSTINKYMDKNNIIFESFGRIQKDGSIHKISFSFKAFEDDCINFFKDLENSEYNFKLTNSYFKLLGSNNQISSRFTIQFNVSDEYEKISIDNHTNKNIFLLSPTKDKNSSYMRIGNNKFYRNNRTAQNNATTKENKTSKKD